MDVIWHRLELGLKRKIVSARNLQAKICGGPHGRALGRNYVETTIGIGALWMPFNFTSPRKSGAREKKANAVHAGPAIGSA